MSSLKRISGLLSICLIGTEIVASSLERRDDCNADNCLRALRNPTQSVGSHSFCSAYISLNTATVTITQTSVITKDAPTTTVPEVLFSTTTSISATVETNLAVVIKVSTTSLSTCSGSPARLSSACSCYIGTTAQPTTITSIEFTTTGPFSTATALSSTLIVITEIVPSTASTTVLTTTTTTTTAVSASTATRACHGNTESLSTVFLRIEGKSDTIFEGFVTNGPTNVTTLSGGATCTTALDEAACEKGFAWDGTWSDAFSDYFVTSIGDSTQTNSQFWGLLLNYQFTPVGGCQQQTKPNDSVLWAFDAFNKAYFLQASFYPDFAAIDGSIGVIHPGTPLTVYVREGFTNTAVEGALVGGVQTNAQGIAILNLAAGRHIFKATRQDSLRSNAITILVR